MILYTFVLALLIYLLVGSLTGLIIMIYDRGEHITTEKNFFNIFLWVVLLTTLTPVWLSLEYFKSIKELI